MSMDKEVKKDEVNNDFDYLLNSDFEENWKATKDLDLLLGKPFVDRYTTEEQQKRDSLVTELLEQYVKTYKAKSKTNQSYKKALFCFCVGSVIIFAVVLMYNVCRVDFSNKVSATSAVQLISVCITFLSLIIGILTIITKYIFPENEEEYITKIVEIIQSNDLENKKENIRMNGGLIDLETEE